MTDKVSILWADDEIDLLKPHLIFLREKGYEVITTTNGNDALVKFAQNSFDIVFLDENMPGLSGLETLNRIKNMKSEIPVIMITKSEEETIMEDAIGSKISDYLIKPVNPNQILLSIKKNLENKRLVSEKTSATYQQEFRALGMMLNERLNHATWAELYKKIVYWELELNSAKDSGLYEVLVQQKSEANNQFCRFIENNYLRWLKEPDKDAPVMSHTLFKKKILPVLTTSKKPMFVILIDNLRYDQWKTIQPLIIERFRMKSEESYYSILPTATQFARNAIFAGLMPKFIEERFPGKWEPDDSDTGKNLYEEAFLGDQLKRLRFEGKFSYTKVISHKDSTELAERILNLLTNRLNVIVVNFVDMLSHSKSEMDMIRELADDEAAYRSLTLSWFTHSPLLEALDKLAEKEIDIIITTDHGTIRVQEPSKVIAERATNTNLRYKHGRALTVIPKDVFMVNNPADAMLPTQSVNDKFAFAKQDRFFVYPNNYNQFVNHYRNTLQHGGVSLEEMIVPFIHLENK
jgi:DNA-binding response OmpR family regulator